MSGGDIMVGAKDKEAVVPGQRWIWEGWIDTPGHLLDGKEGKREGHSH